MDVWKRIASLRHNDVKYLAPVLRESLAKSMQAVSEMTTVVAVRGQEFVLPLTCRIVETLRVQELQTIYFEQRTSKVKDVLYGSHVYGIAVDLVSAEYDWFTGKKAIVKWPDRKDRESVSLQWYRSLASVITKDRVFAWGGLWKGFPDSPHFQAAVAPTTPNKAMRLAYTTAGGGEEGRKAVWRMFALDVSTPSLA